MVGTPWAELAERGTQLVEDVEQLRYDGAAALGDDVQRRDSAILRRLLVDDLLGKVWRDLGFSKQPLLEAYLLPPIIRVVPQEQIRYLGVGAPEYEGVKGPIGRYRGPALYCSPEELVSLATPARRTLPLDRFLDGTVLILDGQAVSRRNLINYVANKRGGVHWDNSRDGPRDWPYSVLDAAWDNPGIVVKGKPSIFLELLGISQSVVGSADVARLLQIFGPKRGERAGWGL